MSATITDIRARKGTLRTTEPHAMAIDLCFSIYGELFRIDLENVMYFQADDHYTHVYLLSGGHFMIPFGLAKVEQAIEEAVSSDKYHLRMGRKYIINMRSVFHVNVMKQVVQLSDNHGAVCSLQMPKPVLRTIIDAIENRTSKEQQ